MEHVMPEPPEVPGLDWTDWKPATPETGAEWLDRKCNEAEYLNRWYR